MGAEVSLIPGIASARGRLGDLVFYQTANGKQCVRSVGKRSTPNLPPTDGQVKQRDKFKEAIAFAKRIKEVPPLRKEYYTRYKRQYKYATFHGYLVAQYYKETQPEATYHGTPGKPGPTEQFYS